MLGKRNPLFVDRTTYSFKGKWKSPNNDIYENIYYFVASPMTLQVDYENGREQVKQVINITCANEHPFVKGDYFYLDNGTKMRIYGITNNFYEPNIAVRDLIKPRIESQTLVLG